MRLFFVFCLRVLFLDFLGTLFRGEGGEGEVLRDAQAGQGDGRRSTPPVRICVRSFFGFFVLAVIWCFGADTVFATYSIMVDFNFFFVAVVFPLLVYSLRVVEKKK